MAGNKFVKLVYSNTDDNAWTFTLAAGASTFVDIDLAHVFNAQILVEATYTATGSPTGLALSSRYGMGTAGLVPTGFTGHLIPACLGGSPDPRVFFSDNEDVISGPVYPINRASPVTIRTFFSLANCFQTLPRFFRLVLTNLDSVNPASIIIYGDF